MTKNSKYIIIVSAFLISIVMISYYLRSRNLDIDLSRLEQSKRAKHVQNKLTEFVVVSEFISRFLQEELQSGDFSFQKNSIEKNLMHYLKSSPPDVIYGIGFWFEPFKFQKANRLFGPYVYRNLSSNNKITLTYDWNSDQYNYPTQDWYKKGLLNDGNSYFVDPYQDNGMVYVTNSRSFVNASGEVLGVISVDVILPQLQSIVERSNVIENINEIIYIVDRNGNVLAHPLKEKIFEMASDSKKFSSLMDFKSPDIEKILSFNSENWLTSEVNVPSLGWKIIVSSKESFLLARVHVYFQILIIVLLILWISVFVAIKFLVSHENKMKEASETIEASRVQLVETSKMAALGVMAGGIAHEINNPLSVIMGNIQLLEIQIQKQNITHGDSIEKIKKIRSTSERITKIISGLKSFSRSGNSDSFAPEYFGKMILDAAQLCSEEFKENQINLEIQPFPNLICMCRSVQISQVFFNLLSNSYDAIQKLDSKWINVFAIDDIQAGQIRIYFIDSGLGIPSDIAKRIMDPFFTTKDVGKGTGLGLSISKGIIEQHGGSLMYDGQRKNTTFVVSLPYQKGN